MTRHQLSSLALTTALSLSFACGDDSTPMLDSGALDGGTDALVTADVPAADVAMADVLGMPDAGPEDPFDTAVSITIGAEPAMEAIEAPGDVDFFSFEGTEGQWVAIIIEANPDGTRDLDTVITLYDASRTQIAENDDAQPRVSTDSELLIRLPATGVYYVEVQEFSSWDGGDPEGQPDYTYALSVIELDGELPGLTIDDEPGDDIATAPAFVWPDANNQFIFGTYRDESDVDLWRFSITEEQQSLTVNVMPQGVDGYGATVETGDVWITSADGFEIIARVDGAADRTLNTSLPPGEYALWVDHPGGAGSNDFYALKARLAEENTLESEVAPGENDTLATAEAITFTDDGMGTFQAFILSSLPADDVDYLSLDVAADEEVTIVCASARNGSGVQGLTASLHDDTDTLRPGATDMESAADTITVVETSPPAGTYYLRLESAGQDPVVSGSWVRCGITVSPAM